MVGCEVMWGELLWLGATWHVMSCHCEATRCAVRSGSATMW